MPKPAALFDIDGAMFRGFCLFPLLDTQVKEGVVAAGTNTAAACVFQEYREGRLGYEVCAKALLNIYAGGLKGALLDEAQWSADEFFASTPDFYAYVAPTIESLRPTHDIALVTAEPQFVAAAVARAFSVECVYGTVFDADAGRFTGTVSSYLATREEKGTAVAGFTAGRPFEGSCAFADSEGDELMLRAVQHPVCIDPTPGLHTIAAQEGWRVVNSAEASVSTRGLSVIGYY